MYRSLAGRTAKSVGAAVFVPSYRLTPEHSHPAGIDDGLAADRSMLDRFTADRLVVGGDSAGGGMSVAVLQVAEREGLPVPAGRLLISPWLDLTGTSETRTCERRQRTAHPAGIGAFVIERTTH